MLAPLRFEGRISRLPYLGWSAAGFLIQHAVVWLVSGRIPELAWASGFSALRLLRPDVVASEAAQLESALIRVLLLILFACVWGLAAWALAAAAFRRAIDANLPESIAILTIIPIVQIPAIIVLSLAPPSSAPAAAPTRDPTRAETAWRNAVAGMATGMVLTLAAVAIGAVLFRTYGTALFLLSPAVIGATTAYLSNRNGDIGSGRTHLTVLGAIALGGMALLLTALEGLLCIILAAPLAFGTAVLGGLVGRSMALWSGRSTAHTLSGLAMMPLIYAGEAVMPPLIAFDTTEVVEISAPPDSVWKALVHMTPINEPVSLPFRLGVAYPISGEIVGEGVGALRRGAFSTGDAVERITEWVPGGKLAVVVESDPPAMHELSPYEQVLSRHVLGYFHTRSMSFELEADSAGRTTLIERTAHELKLDPAAYWLPMAEWVVHENNARILAHIKRDAEQAFHASQPSGGR